MPNAWRSPLLACLVVFSAFPLFAQDKPAQDEPAPARPKIEWHRGPYAADMGEATIQIPENFAFADGRNTRIFMERNHNPTNGAEVGTIIPTNLRDEDEPWYIVYEYDDTGYVNDDEKSDLQPDKLLQHLKDSTEKGNEQRKLRGWAGIHILSWQTPPFYDPKTHNLTWATLAQSDDPKEGEVINYSVRVLGRTGTMRVDLVMDPKSTPSTVPAFTNVMGTFAYKQGRRYIDFAKGDKIAGYGLTALIAGGATAAAIKTGLFTKLLKLIVAFGKFIFIAIAGAWAALRRKLGALFGRKKSDDPMHQPPTPGAGLEPPPPPPAGSTTHFEPPPPPPPPAPPAAS